MNVINAINELCDMHEQAPKGDACLMIASLIMDMALHAEPSYRECPMDGFWKGQEAAEQRIASLILRGAGGKKAPE